MRVLVEVLAPFTDARGLTFEPLAGDALRDARNVHVVLTSPGHVRGNHVHARGVEQLTVVGPALVRTREDGVDHDHSVPEGAVHRFTIPAGVAHAVKNTGDGMMVLASFGSEPYDPSNTTRVHVM
jgi:UDP-2-acetamido-2,6-beta-L-arabino-hexul-4-ose reductase